MAVTCVRAKKQTGREENARINRYFRQYNVAPKLIWIYLSLPIFHVFIIRFVLFCSFLNFCIIYIYSDFDALFISSHRMQFKQTKKIYAIVIYVDLKSKTIKFDDLIEMNQWAPAAKCLNLSHFFLENHFFPFLKIHT